MPALGPVPGPASITRSPRRRVHGDLQAERHRVIRRRVEDLDLARGRGWLHRQPHRPAAPIVGDTARHPVPARQQHGGFPPLPRPAQAVAVVVQLPVDAADPRRGVPGRPRPRSNRIDCTASGNTEVPGFVNSRFSTSHRDSPVDRYVPESTSPGQKPTARPARPAARLPSRPASRSGAARRTAADSPTMPQPAQVHDQRPSRNTDADNPSPSRHLGCGGRGVDRQLCSVEPMPHRPSNGQSPVVQVTPSSRVSASAAGGRRRATLPRRAPVPPKRRSDRPCPPR